MPRTIEFILPIRLESLSRVIRIRGVDVYVHWSVFAVAGLILLGAAWWSLAFSLVEIASYLSVIFIHECGHLIVAQRLRCKVHSIKLYPIWGLTDFEMPWSRFDHCVIAWGGVLAQAVIAIPVVTYVTMFGYTRFEPVNGMLEILGYYSLAIAAINLLPAPPLDGAIAWGIVPEFIRRIRRRRSEPVSRQKYWR
jgi:membrane-associated protease RseP (regulator of RpoE activity)